jgi:uncharacterized protein YjbI with pentapeptide repeats
MTDLGGAEFGRVRLNFADLRGSDLRFANLEKSSLWKARICGADLSYGKFNSSIRGADGWERAIYDDDEQIDLGLARSKKYQRYLREYKSILTIEEKKAFLTRSCPDRPIQ